MENDHTRSSLNAASRTAYHDIREWFTGPLGQHVMRTETAMLEQLLPTFFGYHLAQFSVQDQPMFDSSQVQHKFVVGLESGSGGVCSADSELVSNPVELPFANDSIDVVLLHHLLDFVSQPKEVLREISRVTLPMGHIVIMGFNPFSSWGIWKTVAGIKGNPPWNGDFIRPGRLMDWLNLLDFKIDRAQYAIYRPPIARFAGEVADYSQGVSRTLNLPVGSLYVIVARKHVGAVRSIRPVWKRSRAFGRLSVVRSSVETDGLTSTQHPPQND